MIWGGRRFGDFEVEFLSFGVGLRSVVTGLVFGCRLAGIGRDLLEESMHPQRRWGFGIVEKRNDILCFVLN